MAFYDVASAASVWRGYEYWQDGSRVSGIRRNDDGTISAFVQGAANEPYCVRIDLAHPKKSTCTCPFAEGRYVICKHMVALYFTAVPGAGETFMREVEAEQRAAEEKDRERREEIAAYVRTLTKAQLQEELINALLEIAELEQSQRW